MDASISEMFATPASSSGMSTDEIIKEFIRLDTQIKELAYQRSEYQSALAQAAVDVRNGQKTVHLETSDRKGRIKVEFKSGHVCDITELDCAKELLGDERFNEIFKTEYTPKLLKLKTFLNTKSADERVETARGIIKAAVVEIEKTPWVAVEKK
jgi:hypothetical protein